jgi:hypothetical protein
MTMLCQDLEVLSTDQFASQDIRMAKYSVRTDGEPVGGTDGLFIIDP